MGGARGVGGSIAGEVWRRDTQARLPTAQTKTHHALFIAGGDGDGGVVHTCVDGRSGSWFGARIMLFSRGDLFSEVPEESIWVVRRCLGCGDFGENKGRLQFQLSAMIFCRIWQDPHRSGDLSANMYPEVRVMGCKGWLSCVWECAC